MHTKSNRGSRAGGCPRPSRALALAVVAPAVAAMVVPGTAAAQQATPPPPPQATAAEQTEQAREALDKWVEVRSLIAKEKRDWLIGREMLTDRVASLEREIESLQSRTGEADKGIGEMECQHAALREEQEALKRATASLALTIVEVEKQTLDLVRRLPDPIRERVKPFSQRMPEDPSNTMLSLGERFQFVIGVLNALNRFNREVTLTSEVHTLASGATAEVTALYVGLGQGFYVTAKGDAAGIGLPGADGWTWTPANEAAAAIAKAIAILKGEQLAEFVQLPVQIK